MAVSDDDLDLLETYLDDEMSVADVSILRTRLEHDPELAKVLSGLRAGRAVRKSVFASMELSDAGAVKLLQTVKKNARREQFRNHVNTYARYFGAAAACVVIGFTTGWLGRSGAPGPRLGLDPASSGHVTQTTPVNNETTRPPAGTGGFGGVPSTPGGGAFSVTVTDDRGRVVDVYRFDTREEARRFSEDFTAGQARQKSPRQGVILPGAAEQF